MSIRRVLAAAGACAVLAFGAFQLSGCGPAPDEAVRADITAKLESVKNADDVFVQQAASNEVLGSLETAFGLDADEFLRAYLKGFDYRLDSVEEADDGKVNATVTLTCKSLSGFEEAFVEAADGYADGQDTSAMEKDELNREIGQLALEAVEQAPVVTLPPLTVTYEKDDGTWKPAQEVEVMLRDAIAAA